MVLSQTSLPFSWTTPVRHCATLGDGVTPQVETHAHDGAGQEDGEHHQGADHQVEEGVKEGAAGATKTNK